MFQEELPFLEKHFCNFLTEVFARATERSSRPYARACACLCYLRCWLLMATNYAKWAKMGRDGGALDEMEEALDIAARRGKWNAVDVQAAHDTFTFVPDQSGATWAVSYASPESLDEVRKRAEKRLEVDLAPGGREMKRAAKRFKANAASQQPPRRSARNEPGRRPNYRDVFDWNSTDNNPPGGPWVEST